MIIYCCENINRKIYKIQETSELVNQQKLRSSTVVLLKPQTNPLSTDPLDALQSDYKYNVIENLEIVRKILTHVNSFNYRLELLENLYSLVYLMSNHIKDDEEDGEMDNTTNLDYEKRKSLPYQVKSRILLIWPVVDSKFFCFVQVLSRLRRCK
jgi:hypothetical protein